MPLTTAEMSMSKSSNSYGIGALHVNSFPLKHVTLKSPIMRRNKPAMTSRLHSSGTDLNKVFTTSLRLGFLEITRNGRNARRTRSVLIAEYSFPMPRVSITAMITTPPSRIFHGFLQYGPSSVTFPITAPNLDFQQTCFLREKSRLSTKLLSINNEFIEITIRYSS